jgi:5'-methylthioadenosine phosphorylase
MCIAIIGGSGFYEFFSGDSETQNTPFGQSTPITTFQVGSKEVYFLARHGKEHSIPPHRINYRANIYAIRELNVTYVLATNAVGSCRMEIKPGNLVIPDQLIDFTNGRASSFYEGNLESGVLPEFKRVKHTDVSYPYQGVVRKIFLNVISEMKDIEYHTSGTYICTNGPRFETAAEIQMAKQIGADIVGMTSAPECFLARELDMDYASLCLVTNYGAGMQKRISQEEVVEIFNQKMGIVKEIIMKSIDSLSNLED